MENGIHSAAKNLHACYKAFIERAGEWYGFKIHHAAIESRKKSNACVETKDGGYKDVPYLRVFFRRETFTQVTDDRRQIKDDIEADLRDIWTDLLLPYKDASDWAEYSDRRMIVGAYCYEDECFYEFISQSESKLSDYLKDRTGFRPQSIYRSKEAINIVYETSDYLLAGIGIKSKTLKQEIYHLAQDYVAEKFHESMEPGFEIKFWNPNMRGYNGYWLWLG